MSHPTLTRRIRGFILAAFLSLVVATAAAWSLLALGRAIAGPALIEEVWREQLLALATPSVAGTPPFLTQEEARRLWRRRADLPAEEPGLRARILEQALATTSTLGAAGRVHGALPMLLVGGVLAITGAALWLRTGPIARLRSGTPAAPRRSRRQREAENAAAILDGLDPPPRR
jgi:hypothetical protein